MKIYFYFLKNYKETKISQNIRNAALIINLWTIETLKAHKWIPKPLAIIHFMNYWSILIFINTHISQTDKGGKMYHS